MAKTVLSVFWLKPVSSVRCSLVDGVGGVVPLEGARARLSARRGLRELVHTGIYLLHTSHEARFGYLEKKRQIFKARYLDPKNFPTISYMLEMPCHYLWPPPAPKLYPFTN